MDKKQQENIFSKSISILRVIYSVLAFLISYLYLPKLIASYTGGISAYYISYSLVIVALAVPLLATNRKNMGKLASPLRGVLTAIVIYSLIVILAWMTGTIGGRATVGASGIAMIAIYSIATGLFLATTISVMVIHIRDIYIASAVGGIILAGITGLIAVIADSGPLTVTAIAATNYGLGYILILEARRRGVSSSTLMYGFLMGMIMMGPVTIGGRLLVGGLVIALGSIMGWYLTQLLLDPPSRDALTIPRPKSYGKILALVAILGVMAEGLLYLNQENVVFWKPYAIVTGSMEPAIERGDIVLLERVDSNQLKVGDVITYAKGRLPITHRIYNISASGVIWTKGDANNEVDPYKVHPSQVLGRVKYTIPNMGWALIVVNWSPLIKKAILLTSITIIGIIAFTSIPREDEKQVEES